MYTYRFTHRFKGHINLKESVRLKRFDYAPMAALNVYGCQRRTMDAKAMFLSYQKSSCKFSFSRTRAFK